MTEMGMDGGVGLGNQVLSEMGLGETSISSPFTEVNRSSGAASYDGGSGIHKEVNVQYLYSIYWALMTLTTVGYGDITPTNDTERVYVLFCLLVGAVVFGFLLSTLGDVLSNVDQNATKIEETASGRVLR